MDSLPAASASPNEPKPTSVASPSDQPKRPTPTDLTAFFARMEHLYGHRWTGQYGRATNDDATLTLSGKQWRHDLNGFSPKAIQSALKRCERLYPDWPPTVPQFKALVREAQPPNPPDPRQVAHGLAELAWGQVLADARLGVIERRLPDYGVQVTAALEAIGGAAHLLQLDAKARAALGARFVRAHASASPALTP